MKAPFLLLFAIGLMLPWHTGFTAKPRAPERIMYLDAEPRLDGGPAQLRYPAYNTKIISLEDAKVPASGIRIFRGGEVSYTDPSYRFPHTPVSYEQVGNTRIIRLTPRPRYGTAVVYAPQAFRPVEP